MNDVADARFRRLREVRLQSLNDEHDQHFPGKRRAVLEREQNEFEDFFLHRRTKKLTPAGSNGGPKVGR